MLSTISRQVSAAIANPATFDRAERMYVALYKVGEVHAADSDEADNIASRWFKQELARLTNATMPEWQVEMVAESMETPDFFGQPCFTVVNYRGEETGAVLASEATNLPVFKNRAQARSVFGA